MIRLSVPLRQAIAKLVLPLLIAASFALMLLGKADTVIAERARVALADLLVPVYGILSRPVGAAQDAVAAIRALTDLHAENARLREENARLKRWHDVAMALEAENHALRAVLNAPADPTPGFITARVVADTGTAYARSVLLSTGPRHAVRKGQVALDQNGLVGRVSEVGSRSARILLVTDINSRIPVQIERTRARAILAGTNGPVPRLQHWSDGMQPQPGDRIVTSAQAGAFPAGLPVGTVRAGPGGVMEVELSAELSRLEFVRLHDFGLSGVLPPEQVTRPEAPARRRGGS